MKLPELPKVPKVPKVLSTLRFGVLLLLIALPARAEIVDRVLAVVGGELITLSDVMASMRFGLVPGVPPDQDRVRATLDLLISRQLQLIEVNRYLPPEPSDATIDARVASIRARFASDAAFDAALAESGLTVALLRARIRDTLRIDRYLEQRFGAGFQPSEEEIARYYRANEAEFTVGGVLRPFADVRDEIRTRLSQERTSSLVKDWVAGLRRRAEVTVLPIVPLEGGRRP
jgi:hypothetical protein